MAPTTTTEHIFAAPEALDLVDISYRQLNYWTTEGLLGDVALAAPEEFGAGGRSYRYTFGHLVRLDTIRALVDAGVSFDAIRAFMAEADLHSVGVLTVDADGVVQALPDDERMMTVRELIHEMGRTVVILVNVPALAADLEAKVVDANGAREALNA